MAQPVDFLAMCPLFAKLTDEERAACHERMTERVCPKGSKIIVANTIATEFFLIKSGTCDVTQDGGGFLEALVPGNYFGGALARISQSKHSNLLTTKNRFSCIHCRDGADQGPAPQCQCCSRQ